MSAISITAQAAADYLASMDAEARLGLGRVYTPAVLARFIIDRTLAPTKRIEGRLLDPACGGGVFLQVLVHRVADQCRSEGWVLSTPLGRRYFVSQVESALWGIDVDAEACELTRRAVRHAVSDLIEADVPDAWFAGNVVCADFLLDELPECVREPYDTVVGNPPYVSAVRLSAEFKERVRARFATASGRLDLYTLFLERAALALKPGGRLGFITPDKFLASQSARKLRTLLTTEGYPVHLAQFRSHRVFENAATVPCVLVWERGKSRADVAFEAVEPDSDGHVLVTDHETKHAKLDHTPWVFVPRRLERLAEKLRARRPVLSSFAARISAGLATGRDGVFVVDPAEVEVEAALLKPAIRGRDLLPYEIRPPTSSVIVPYDFSEGRPRLIDIESFPLLRGYLERFRAELELRHCVRVWQKAWYDVHDPVSLDVAAEPKILVPDLAEGSRFAFDSGGLYPLHSVYYILPHGIEPRYLLAVLNSTPIEFLIRLTAPVAKDGFSRYRKQFLETLPVPNVSESQVARVVGFLEHGDLAAVDAEIVAAFGLDTADLAAMQEYLAAIARPGRRATAQP